MSCSSNDEVMAKEEAMAKEEVMMEDQVAAKEEAMAKEEVMMEDDVPPKDEIIEAGDKEICFPSFMYNLKRPLHKWSLLVPESELIFVIRTAAQDEPCPASAKLLESIRLYVAYTGVFIKADERIMRILRELRPYVDYGHPPPETIKLLIHNMAFRQLDNNKIIRLADNPSLVGQEFGEYNIFTLEDIVNEIANVGPHFEDVSEAIFPFLVTIMPKRKKGKKKQHSLLKNVLTSRSHGGVAANLKS